MAKTSDPALPETPDATALEAADAAQAAAARQPEFPGYEAVRDLYESFLRLSRQYEDLAGVVEQLKNELADMRRGAVSNG